MIHFDEVIERYLVRYSRLAGGGWIVDAARPGRKFRITGGPFLGLGGARVWAHHRLGNKALASS